MHWQGPGKKVMLALRHQVILNATGRSLCKGFSCSMLLSSGIFSWDEGDQEQQISVKESCVSSLSGPCSVPLREVREIVSLAIGARHW